jgi:hypothetical protein
MLTHIVELWQLQDPCRRELQDTSNCEENKIYDRYNLCTTRSVYDKITKRNIFNEIVFE